MMWAGQRVKPEAEISLGAPRNAPLRTGRCRVRRLRSSITIATFAGSNRPASDHKPVSFPFPERSLEGDVVSRPAAPNPSQDRALVAVDSSNPGMLPALEVRRRLAR